MLLRCADAKWKKLWGRDTRGDPGRALQAFEGNRSRVARELGINRTTLYNKLRQYEIR